MSTTIDWQIPHCFRRRRRYSPTGDISSISSAATAAACSTVAVALDSANNTWASRLAGLVGCVKCIAFIVPCRISTATGVDDIGCTSSRPGHHRRSLFLPPSSPLSHSSFVRFLGLANRVPSLSHSLSFHQPHYAIITHSIYRNLPLDLLDYTPPGNPVVDVGPPPRVRRRPRPHLSTWTPTALSTRHPTPLVDVDPDIRYIENSIRALSTRPSTLHAETRTALAIALVDAPRPPQVDAPSDPPCRRRSPIPARRRAPDPRNPVDILKTRGVRAYYCSQDWCISCNTGVKGVL